MTDEDYDDQFCFLPNRRRANSRRNAQQTTCPVCHYPDAHLMSDGSGVLCIPSCGYMSWKTIEELNRPTKPTK